MKNESKRSRPKRTYVKLALTAISVVFFGVLLYVIFSDLPGFFDVLDGLSDILSPLVLGCVLAFLLNPLVATLDRWLRPLLQKRSKDPVKTQRTSRAISILCALVFAGLVIYAFCAMLLPQLYESIMGIVANAEGYYRSLETWIGKILADNPGIQGYVDVVLEKVYTLASTWMENSLLSDMQKLLATLTTSVMAVVGWFTDLLIGLAASVYILWSKDLFKAQAKKMVVAFCPPRTADHLLYLARETHKIFNGFVIGKIIDSAIIGFLCYFGMLILKLPYPALIATVIGITNVIPFFGPIIGAVPCAVLILLVNPMQVVSFAIFVLCLQQLDGNVIGPKILGDSIGISGFWVLVSITVAAGLFGFAGMLLGVPVFAVLYMLVSDAVNLALTKRGSSTNTADYENIQSVEDLEKREEEEIAES